MSLEDPLPSEIQTPSWLSLFKPSRLTLVLVIIVFFVLTRTQLAERPLWLDELHTSWVVNGSWSDLVQRALISNQSPLYFSLVKCVTELSGNTPLGLRFLSILANGLLAIACMTILFRWTHHWIATVVIGCLTVIHEPTTWFSVEARCYSLVALVGVIQVFFCVECFVSSSHRIGMMRLRFNITALFASSLLLFYLHYSAGLLLLAELIGIILWLGKNCHFHVERVKGLQRLLLFSLLVTALAIPGLAHCYLIIQKDYDWHLVSHLQTFINQFLLDGLVLIGPPGLILLGIRLRRLGLSGQQTESKMNSAEPAINRNFQSFHVGNKCAPIILLLVACTLLPPLIIVLLDRMGVVHLALIRYAVSSMAILLLLSGTLLAKVNETRMALVIGVLMLSLVYGTNPWLQSLLIHRGGIATHPEDWRKAIHTINQLLDQQPRPVFVFPNLVEDTYFAQNPSHEFDHYYRFPLEGLYPINRRDEIYFAGRSLEGKAPFRIEDVTAMVRDGGGFCLIRGDHQTVEAWISKGDAQFRELQVRLQIDSIVFERGVLALIEIRLR